jgi:hypothetical protein
MRVVEDQSSVMSWVTIVCLIGLGVVGYVGYQNRERFLPTNKDATPKVARGKVSEEVEARFFEARDKIVGGKYDEASAILTAIDTDKVPQPTRNWITLQNGAARLLAGKLPEARAEFAKVEQRGPFSTDPREEKLAKFFVEMARRAASDEPQKSDVAQSFDADSTEAFALLVFGLKDWILGSFEDASSFFRQFKSAATPETEIWLRRYKPLADAFVESFGAYQMASDAAKEAGGDHERKQRALATIRDAKAKLKNQPGLTAKLTEIEGELKTQVDAAIADMNKADAATMEADNQVITDVKNRVAMYNEKFQFADGNQIVFTATVTTDKAKAELDKWMKRTTWLSKFKSTLIDDISAAGYAKPLTKKDGTSLATGVKSADDSQLLTPAKVPVQWTELASDSIIAMAKDFIAKNSAPDAALERKWLLGNFFYQLGRKPEAFALLREGSAAKPEYKDGLALFPE